MEELAGRVAVVAVDGRTGFSIAARLAATGATVVVVDADHEAADRAAARIRRDWGTAAVQVVDIADAAGCEAALAEIRRTCGGVDIIVLPVATGGAGEALRDAALEEIDARGAGTLVLIGSAADDHAIAAVEEKLSEARREIARRELDGVRAYALVPMVPGGDDLGAAIAHIAVHRPGGELEGRLIVVPPSTGAAA